MIDPDSSERSPSLAEVIERTIAARLAELHTSIPARIVRYDAALGLVDAKPLVKRAYLDEDNARQLESLPVVTNCPVVWPQGGGYRLTFPIKADPSTGDICMLLVSQASLDKWLSGTGAEVDPVFDHGHHLADAVALVGVRPFGQGAPLQGVPTDHATLGLDGADDGQHVKIHLRDSTICVGDESGSDFIALAQKVLDEFTKLQHHFSQLEGVITGSAIPEPGNGSPSAFQAALALVIGIPYPGGAGAYPAPSSVAAQQGKTK